MTQMYQLLQYREFVTVICYSTVNNIFQQVLQRVVFS
jgi:hypothetical protein